MDNHNFHPEHRMHDANNYHENRIEGRPSIEHQRRQHAHYDDGINEGSIEIIENKLYFLSSEDPPISDQDSFYFSTDSLPELQYDPFHKDFGPLKLSMMHRF